MVAFIIIAVAIAVIALAILARYPSYRGKRVVVCPETHQAVGAEINAWLAARTELAGGPRYVISACSRWPGRAGCDQACAPQVAAMPRETLVRNIVAHWYQDRACTFCGEKISDIHGIVVPGLRGVDGTVHDWTDIAPEDLPKVLRESAPVCARCDLVENFRHDRAQLVIERPTAPREHHAPLSSSAVY